MNFLLGFICAHKSHYDDYIATKNNCLSKNTIFSIYQKFKYRNIDLKNLSIYCNSLWVRQRAIILCFGPKFGRKQGIIAR